MSEALLALAVLACPVGMGAMMWFMMRGSGHGQSQTSRPGVSSTDAEITKLRAELDQLRAAQRDGEAREPR